MPAPRNPNTAAATAVRLRLGDAKAVARLRARGYLVVAPGEVPAGSPAELAREVLAGGNAGEAESSLHRLVPKLAGVAQALRALGGAGPEARRPVEDLYRRMLTAIAEEGARGRR